MKGLHRGKHILLLGAGRQGQAVDVDILLRDACRQCRVPDAAGNGHAVLGFGQDTPLVNGKADHRRAVLFAQGQNGVQLFRLAVHRVDDGLAVVDPQAPFQRLDMRGIQLQRQADHALQRLDHLLHQGRLIHAGRTYVHIQDLGPGLGLAHGLFQHIVHIPFPQGLLEPLFSGGIDALTHHRDAVHIHAVHGAAHHRLHWVVRAARPAIGKHAVQQLDEFRGGAAAAACSKQAQFPVGLHLHGVELRGDIVARAIGAGQACVGLDEHREAAGQGLGQPLCHGEDLLGAKRAVDPHGIGPQAPGGGGKALDRAASKGAAACFKAHAGQHGQAAVLLDGQQGGLQLIQIGKGLKEHEVSPGGHARPDDAAILCHGILKRKGAVGFQQLPQGAHIQCGQCAVRSTGPLAVGNTRRNDLLQRVLAVCQLVGGSAKGIGIDDAAACGGIPGMDALDERRVGDVQLLGAGPQFQARSLQHGAHAAIQQDGIGPVKQFIRLHR